MKYLFVLFFLLFSLIGTIPYWTGQLAHRQLPLLTERLSENIPLKISNGHYEQGWFRSSAESTFTIDTPTLNQYPLTLQHTIDHGFLPAQSPNIRSILLGNLPLCTSSELLNSHTSFQITGEGTSSVAISPCTLAIEIGLIRWQAQWQALQGEIHFTRDFSKISGQLQNPQIQVNTGSARIIMQDIAIRYLLEQVFLTELDIMMSALHIVDNATIKLEQVRLKNTIHEMADYLTIVMNSYAQQAFVDTEPYGPVHLDCSIQHLHIETLQAIRTTLQALYNRDLSFLQRNLLLTTVIMQQIPTLLEHSPRLIIPRWNFQTPAGKVEGMLQVEIETFDKYALFDPFKLTEMLTVQSKLQLPYPILKQLAQWTLEYQGIIVTEDAVEQRVQFWLTEGFFIPSPTQANYYQTQWQSRAGILQINEKKMSWQELLRR